MGKHKKNKKSKVSKGSLLESKEVRDLISKLKQSNESKRRPVPLKEEPADPGDDVEIVHVNQNSSIKLQHDVSIKNEPGCTGNEVKEKEEERDDTSSKKKKAKKKKKKKSRSSSSSSSSPSSSSVSSSGSETSSSSSSSDASSSDQGAKKRKKSRKKSSSKSRRSPRPALRNPDLYSEYNKTKNRKNEAKGVMAPYTLSRSTQQKTNQKTVVPAQRKTVTRNFICLPEKNSFKVPKAVTEWRELTSVGLGEKKLTVFEDATAEELKLQLYREFEPLVGENFYFAKAEKSQLDSANFIVGQDTSMKCLLSTFREKGSKDIFIVPMDRDLVLPEPDVAKIPCEICEDWILSFNHRKHMEDHAMNDEFLNRPLTRKVYAGPAKRTLDSSSSSKADTSGGSIRELED